VSAPLIAASHRQSKVDTAAPKARLANILLLMHSRYSGRRREFSLRSWGKLRVKSRTYMAIRFQFWDRVKSLLTNQVI